MAVCHPGLRADREGPQNRLGGSLLGSLPRVLKPPHRGVMPVPLRAAQHPPFTSKPTSSAQVVVPRCLRKVGVGWGG